MSVVNENYNRWLSSKVVDEKTKEILRNMSNEEKDDFIVLFLSDCLLFFIGNK